MRLLIVWAGIAAFVWIGVTAIHCYVIGEPRL